MKASLATPFAAVLVAASLFAGQQARADTMFTLSNVQDVYGDSYTGSFDASGTSVYNVDITVTNPNYPESATFTDSSGDLFCALCNPTNQYDEFRFETTIPELANLSLYFDVADPLNLNGVNPLITDPENTNDFSDMDVDLLSGDSQDNPVTIGITQGALIAQTVPEPATFALFGFGLLCLGFAAARRSRASQRT